MFRIAVALFFASLLSLTPGTLLADQESPLTIQLGAPLVSYSLAQMPDGAALRVQDISSSLIPGGMGNVNLQKFNAYTADARVELISDTGTQTLPISSVSYFHGNIEGLPESRVFWAIDPKGDMRGIIHAGDRTEIHKIRSGQNPSEMPVQSARLVKPSTDFAGRKFECGNEKHRLETPQLPGINPSQQLATASSSVVYDASIIVETDPEYYRLFNHAANATTYTTDLYAYVSSVYQQEVKTNLKIKLIRLYTAGSSPWTASSSTLAQLEQLGNHYRSTYPSDPRTLVTLLSGKRTGGGIAYVSSLCRGGSNAYDFAVAANLEGSFDPQNPQVVWDATVVAHETGHSFSSGHTHCYGGIGGVNQPVDACWNRESGSGCWSGSTSLPGVASLSGGISGQGNGTIMSYCHQLSGGMSNISATFGTNHPYGIVASRVPSQMRGYVESVAASYPSCLVSASSSFSLSVSKTGTGSGTVTSTPSGINCGSDCSESYTSGTSVTLTASPASGSSFAGWAGACSGVANTCTVSMSQARSVTATFNVQSSSSYTLSVSKSGSGSGTITSSPSGINCGSDCSESYTSGTSVTLTASPASGSSFAGWAGACSGGANTCTVSMSQARSVTATFNVQSSSSYTLSVSKSGLGSGTITSSPSGINCGSDCSESYTSGTRLTLTASPASGSIFGGWGGACSGTARTCSVTMTQAQSVYASFTTSSSKVTLTVNKTGNGLGTVTSLGTSPILRQLNEQPDTSEIVGGVAAAEGAWPWQVALNIDNRYMCGGSILSDRWVVTAAHCIEGFSASAVKVRAGSLYYSSGGTVSNVSRIIKHNAYNTNTQDNDIALLELSTPLTLSNVINQIKPLPTSSESSLTPDGTLATVTGWGTTSPGGNTSSYLMQVNVPLLSPSTCAASTPYGNRITNNMICAGYASGGKDSCQGDSGGPLVVPDRNGGYRLAGIVSWGNSCAKPNYPGVYTRVANYEPWIETNTGLSFDDTSINCGSTCSADFDLGSTLTLQATSTAGSQFTGWGGACSGASSTCTVSMSAAKFVTANFKANFGGTYAQQVMTMFTGYFGRPASASGMAYYEAQMNQSAGNYKILVDDFFNSSESQSFYGGKTIEQQVTAVFQQLFGRDPASAGLSYWSEQVRNGTISVAEMAYTVAYNAQEADTAVLQAKRDASLAFSMALNNSERSRAYANAPNFGRQYLTCVRSDRDAKAAINKIEYSMTSLVNGNTTYSCP